jgi:hypothetical protein
MVRGGGFADGKTGSVIDWSNPLPRKVETLHSVQGDNQHVSF